MTRTILAVIGLLSTALVLPALAQTDEIALDYEKFTLDNGLRVIVHEDRKAPVVAVAVWYDVGSADEPDGRSGFAHLFEHLMFNGSENYDGEFFEPLEQVGATGLNGTTNFDRTNYFETVPTPALDLALWLESDRMGHLLGAITQDKLDEQRGVVQNEKRQGENQPYGRVFNQIVDQVFPEGHPYDHTVIGSMEDLNAASLEDVKDWFRTYYGAGNAIVVLAGDIDAEEARPLMEKYFGDVPPGPPLSDVDGWVPELDSNIYETMQDRVPQARLYRIWTAPGRTTETAQKLQLAADVLGDGKNSRLYKDLVYDKQIATNAASFFLDLELTSLVGITVDVKQGEDPKEVAAAVDEVIADFLQSGPTRDELTRAVTKIEFDTIQGLEQVGGFGGKAVTLASGELYAGDPAFVLTALERYRSATARDVKSEANDWMSRPFYQLTVVPYGNPSAASGGADRSALPEVAQTPDLTFPKVQTAELSNGLEVVLAERDAVPVVELELLFDAGYAADNQAGLGVASFTLEMLDEGTKKRDALEIAAELEELGAELSTGSSLDTSSVGLTTLKRTLEPSVQLMADVVRNATFPEAEIDRLRQQRLARIRQEMNQPVSIALRTLPPLLYGEDHAYAVPLTGSGTIESVTALSRDDLTAFQRNWLRPDKARLFVVGDTSLDQIMPILEEAFGSWRAPDAQAPSKQVDQVSLPEQSTVYLIDRPDSVQSMILAGHLAPSSASEQDVAIQAMNDILGGTFTSRVNMNLREDKGWSYGAFTFLVDARGQRPMMVFAPVQTDKTKESVQEILAELEAFRSENPATEAELDKTVKNNVRSLPGRFETAGAVLNHMTNNASLGRSLDYATTLKDRYQALDTETIQQAAQDVVQPEKLTWVIIGDVAKIRPGLEELGIGTIEVLEQTPAATSSGQ